MSIFSVDLMNGSVHLFAGDFFSSGGTSTSGSTYTQVNYYSELPSAALFSSKIFIVRNGSGNYIADRKESGMYFSDGADWRHLNDLIPYFNSSNFQIYDNSMNTKGFKFETSGISTNTFRTIKIQNNDGSIALLSDVDLKVDTTLFDSFTGTTLPNNYYNKSQINSYSGETLTNINSRLLKSTFNDFTGTTLPFNYYNKTQINNYTGETLTELRLLENYIGNGIISGFTISINTDNTKINISPGLGYIINNHTNPKIPVKTIINYTGKTGITLSNLSTDLLSYLAINTSQEIVQQSSQFTSVQRRDYILLGAAIHTDKTIVNAINNSPDVVLDNHNQFNDLLDSLKNFNVEGNVFNANGANLYINKSVGKIFKRGVNFSIDSKNPHIKTL
jgi:hypothetical protein